MYNEFINLVYVKFALDDPVVHYACGFRAPNRLFYQSNWLLSVFKHIWELLQALSIHNRNIKFVFLLNTKYKQVFNGGHLGFHGGR